MEELENYNEEYIDSKLMIRILEDNYEKSIDEIIKNIVTTEFLLKENEVKEFLDKRFQTDNKELYEWYKKEKNNSIINIGMLTPEEAANNFINRMEAAKYNFNSHTLNHYKKFIDVLKEKSFLLINLINKISSNSVGDSEEELINKLDIVLVDEKIRKSDAKRLLKPAIYNYDWLKEIEKEANDLETYLHVQIDPAHDAMYPKIPCEELQKSATFHDINGCDGYVELTEKQINEQEERFKEGTKELAKMINSLW